MTDSLFRKWRAYEKLVENDYMGHARFFQRVEDEVKRRCGKPIAILDLGCGNVVEFGARAGYDRVVSLAEDDLNRLVVLETSTW